MVSVIKENSQFVNFELQDWCANIRKEAAIVRLDEDSHSPNIFR